MNPIFQLIYLLFGFPLFLFVKLVNKLITSRIVHHQHFSSLVLYVVSLCKLEIIKNTLLLHSSSTLIISLGLLLLLLGVLLLHVVTHDREEGHGELVEAQPHNNDQQVHIESVGDEETLLDQRGDHKVSALMTDDVLDPEHGGLEGFLGLITETESVLVDGLFVTGKEGDEIKDP